MPITKATSRDKEIDKIIGETTRRLRLERDISQKALGELLGVTFQQIQKYERGVNSVAAARIPDLCKALEVSPNELFAWTEAKQTQKRAERRKRR